MDDFTEQYIPGRPAKEGRQSRGRPAETKKSRAAPLRLAEQSGGAPKLQEIPTESREGRRGGGGVTDRWR